MVATQLHKRDNHKMLTGFFRRISRVGLLCTLFPGAGTMTCAMEQDYRIEIDKSEQVLMVKKGGQLISSYHIAHGKGGNGDKHRQGDNRTPVGNYRVMNFKADSKFHYFMQLDYPNLKDAWHGYQDKTINEYDFREIAAAYKNREVPPQNTALGGYIGIHGLGEVTTKKLKIHNEFNWTEGCIALSNREINELRSYITVGTRIIIRE